MKRKRELIAVETVRAGNDPPREVELWIDVAALCRVLGRKAIDNTNSRSRLADGAVEVRVRP